MYERITKDDKLAFYEMEYMERHPELSSNTTKITINQILKDNWEVYKFLHKNELREVEIKEVLKTITCQDSSRGYAVYKCPNCGELLIRHFGCNSKLCSHCGKKYTDKWSKELAKTHLMSNIDI